MLLLIGICCVARAIPSQAYTMADYWMFNAGNVWIYDRDLFAMGSDTHTFGTYTGNIFIMACEEYCGAQAYIYTGAEGISIVGFYDFESGQQIDISASPIKLADAEMSVNDSVSTAIPAGVIDENAISITITLEAVETVAVHAGTFDNALRLKIFIDDGVGTYTEKIWLAKGVGMVQMNRVSETNNTPGCFFTCGSLYCDDDDGNVEDRYILLREFIRSDENCWKDINGDNKTGLEEAIHALQVVSGTTSQ